MRTHTCLLLVMAFVIPTVTFADDGWLSMEERYRRRAEERERKREENRRRREEQESRGSERTRPQEPQKPEEPKPPVPPVIPEEPTRPAQPEQPTQPPQPNVPASPRKGQSVTSEKPPRSGYPRMEYAERLRDLEQQNREQLGFAEQELILAKINEQWLRSRITTGKTETGHPISNLAEARVWHVQAIMKVANLQLKYAAEKAICNKKISDLKEAMPEDAAAWDHLREKHFGAPKAQ